MEKFEVVSPVGIETVERKTVTPRLDPVSRPQASIIAGQTEPFGEVQEFLKLEVRDGLGGRILPRKDISRDVVNGERDRDYGVGPPCGRTSVLFRTFVRLRYQFRANLATPEISARDQIRVLDSVRVDQFLQGVAEQVLVEPVVVPERHLVKVGL